MGEADRGSGGARARLRFGEPRVQDAEAEGVGSGLVGGGSGAGLGGGVVGGGVVGGGVVGGGVVGGGVGELDVGGGLGAGEPDVGGGLGAGCGDPGEPPLWPAWPVLPGDAGGSTPTGVGPSSPGSGPSAAWCEWVFLVSVGRTAAGEEAPVSAAGVCTPEVVTTTADGPGNDCAMRWTSIVPGTMSTATATDGATTLRDMLRRIPDLLLPVLPFTERPAAPLRYVPSALAVREIRNPRLTGGVVNGMAVISSGPNSLSPRRWTQLGHVAMCWTIRLRTFGASSVFGVIPGDRVGLQDLARGPAGPQHRDGRGRLPELPTRAGQQHLPAAVVDAEHGGQVGTGHAVPVREAEDLTIAIGQAVQRGGHDPQPLPLGRHGPGVRVAVHAAAQLADELVQGDRRGAAGQLVTGQPAQAVLPGDGVQPQPDLVRVRQLVHLRVDLDQAVLHHLGGRPWVPENSRAVIEKGGREALVEVREDIPARHPAAPRPLNDLRQAHRRAQPTWVLPSGSYL